nr:uncharacterized protein CI109_001287 [Kwoniella shandongensis]KAA5530483.1 hypothetical protein CI109_001287 [Kwoniella shandongensis]
MSPSSPSKMPRTKSKKRIHRGDVSSSAASSEAEDDIHTTPKRKILNAIEAPVSTGKKGKKRETLAERLAAAAAASAASGKAKVKKSQSVGEGLKESATIPSDSSSMQTTPQQTRSEIIPSTMPNPRTMTASGSSASGSDKVVVCVRIKPTRNPFATTAYDITPTSLALSDEHPKVKQRGGKAGREDGYTYTFDKLLQYPSTTPELYGDKVAPLVEKAMNGFNSTVFAYGQTGSGKSFTMTGTPEELGIIPCAVDGVFDAITADPDRAFLLRVSYIEIYNETLRDLLNFKKGPLRDDEKPTIHFVKGKVYVEPLVEEIVSTPEDVMELLEKGNAGRRIGATDWNERSSRSHCVFTIVIESRPRDGDADEDIRLSRLNLIDLAGSEKAVSDSERRGEGKHINQSLLALREVINKLTEKTKASHIPYRNSKLTHLLENALGGDSNICVICTMSAEEEHCSETLETLKFAGRCSQVKTNAKKNVLPSSERALIRAKDQEIEELRQRLQGLTGQQAQRAEPDNDHITDLAESVAAMEARRARLKEQLAKLNGEILTSELPRPGSGFPMSPPKPKRRRISDFSAIMGVGTNRIGLGLGTPQKMNDRRAISGMTRVPEGEEEMPGIMGTLESVTEGSLAKSFDQDRILAGLRRALAAKEEELSLANRNLANALARASQLSQRDERIATLTSELSANQQTLADLQASLDHMETTLRDQNAQLEATRIELVSTVSDKTSKIDELETKVLDLRKSREELVIEDQGRLEEVEKKVEVVERERAELRAMLAEAKERADVLQREGAEEAQRLKDELAAAVTQHSESQQSASAMTAEQQSTVASLNTQIADLLAAQTTRDEELTSLQSAQAQLEQQRDQALTDLDRFQKEALSNEAKVLSELRQEIGNLRKLREDDQATWNKQREELQGQLTESHKRAHEETERVKATERELESTRLALAESQGREEKLAGQMSDALMTLEQAAKANAGLEDRLRNETQAKVVIEKERDDARSRAAEAGGAAKQLEEEIVARKAAEEKLAEALRLSDERLAAQTDLSTQLQDERSKKKDLESKLAEMSRQLEERLMNDSEVSATLEAAKNDLEGRLAAAQKDLEIQDKRFDSEVAARQDADKRVGEMATIRDEAVGGQRELERRLEKESSSLQNAEKRIAELEGQRAESGDAAREWENKLKVEQAARREAEEKMEDLVMDREIVEQARDDAHSKLEEESEKRIEVEKKLASLFEQHSACATSQSEVQERLEREIAARQHAEEEVLRLQHAQEAGATSHVELGKRLNDESNLREAAEVELTKLKQMYNAEQSDTAKLQSLLEAESAARVEANKKLAKLAQQLDSVSAESQEMLKGETAARKEAEQNLIALSAQIDGKSSLQEQLGAEIAARQAAERQITELSKELVTKHEAAQQVLEEELLSLRQSLRAAQLDATQARTEADAERTNIVKLSQEVGLLRSMSTTTLRSRRKSSGLEEESDEIERLEKVVEVQQRIIDEQREKIERWAKEMEKQREIVRLLTHDNTANIPSPKFNSPRPTHGKSHSLSHSPGHNGPPAKGFPSTFTARNLALPSTPTPLPMHPNQFSNAALRKGRRVTIEHDIDRLSVEQSQQSQSGLRVSRQEPIHTLYTSEGTAQNGSVNKISSQAA